MFTVGKQTTTKGQESTPPHILSVYMFYAAIVA